MLEEEWVFYERVSERGQVEHYATTMKGYLQRVHEADNGTDLYKRILFAQGSKAAMQKMEDLARGEEGDREI